MLSSLYLTISDTISLVTSCWGYPSVCSCKILTRYWTLKMGMWNIMASSPDSRMWCILGSSIMTKMRWASNKPDTESTRPVHYIRDRCAWWTGLDWTVWSMVLHCYYSGQPGISWLLYNVGWFDIVIIVWGKYFKGC